MRPRHRRPPRRCRATPTTITINRLRVACTPSAGRLVVADRQHVEHAPVREQHDPGDHRVRQEQADLVPAGGGEPTEDPRVHLADRVLVALLHVGLQRGEEAGDRHPGEDAATPSTIAHRPTAPSTYGQGDGHQRADERGERRRGRAWPRSAAAPTITIVTPSPAPAAAPSRYGSASGLRNTPW